MLIIRITIIPMILTIVQISTAYVSQALLIAIRMLRRITMMITTTDENQMIIALQTQLSQLI